MPTVHITANHISHAAVIVCCTHVSEEALQVKHAHILDLSQRACSETPSPRLQCSPINLYELIKTRRAGIIAYMQIYQDQQRNSAVARYLMYVHSSLLHNTPPNHDLYLWAKTTQLGKDQIPLQNTPCLYSSNFLSNNRAHAQPEENLWGQVQLHCLVAAVARAAA